MQGIILKIFSIAELKSQLQSIFSSFNWETDNEQNIIIERYFTGLKKDLTIILEYPYVDKFYRDSFYNYFSSKHKAYPRDTIRLSLFAKPFEKHQIYETNSSFLSDNFLGYIILRPTIPRIIGRSMISPKAYLKNDFYCCLSSDTISLVGHRLTVHAFPHASQDKETISCAETTIWSLMEYFSSRYVYYTPTAPSKIIETLNEYSAQRMLPSGGLTILQISMALKKFGFATQIYAQEKYKSEFNSILETYIESGIPLIAALKNSNAAHAVLIIGHSSEIGKANKKYVIIDDNYPPYQIATADKPGSYYTREEYKNYEITNFVVPLYPKIYMDATKAHNLVKTILKHKEIGLKDYEKGIQRILLTSSKSFKFRLSQSKAMNTLLKKQLLAFAMPKFIWVCELTNSSLLSKKSANGLILLDATGKDSFSSIIFLYYPGRKIYVTQKGELAGQITTVDTDYGDFPIYMNNLKGGWNGWKAN